MIRNIKRSLMKIMNKININGNITNVKGNDISVINGKVYVDGALIAENLSGDVHITFEGDLATLDTDGSADIKGDVKGHVNSGGSVECGNVGRDVNSGGSVKCKSIGGDISAGGSVKLK